MRALAFAFATAGLTVALSSQQTLAFWTFDKCGQDYASRGHDPCTSGGELTSGGLLLSEPGNPSCVLVIGPYSRVDAVFRVDPRGGNPVSLGSIQFDVMRVSCSWHTRVTVEADEDPGPGGDNFQTPLGGMYLPRESATTVMQARPVSVNLGGFPFLQNVTRPIHVRLRFSGSHPPGCDPVKLLTSCLDNVRISGTCVCAKASATDLGSASCSPQLTMTVDRPPALGTTVTFSFGANSQNDPVYLWISAGCGTGKTILWPTTCRLWLDPQGYWQLAGRVTLDATGRAYIKVPIPTSLAPFTGLEFGAQSLLWTTTGDGLSNGYCLRLGCQ